MTRMQQLRRLPINLRRQSFCRLSFLLIFSFEPGKTSIPFTSTHTFGLSYSERRCPKRRTNFHQKSRWDRGQVSRLYLHSQHLLIIDNHTVNLFKIPLHVSSVSLFSIGFKIYSPLLYIVSQCNGSRQNCTCGQNPLVLTKQSFGHSSTLLPQELSPSKLITLWRWNSENWWRTELGE